MLSSYRVTPDVTAPAHTGRAVAVLAFVCPADGRLTTAQVAKGEGVRVGLTSYVGVAGTASWRKDGVLFSGRGVRLGEVTDGASNTLFAGERPPDEGFDLGWWYAGRGIDGAGTFDMLMGVAENDPSPLTAAACGLPVVPFGPASGVSDRCGPYHFWSLHPGGAHFALCDGSVRFLRYSAGPTLRPLATRAAGDTAPLD